MRERAGYGPKVIADVLAKLLELQAALEEHG